MRGADGYRGLGDLKCSQCSKVTTHAILEYYSPVRDREEELDLIARGATPDYGILARSKPHLDKLRDEYRQLQPQNPYLSHIWLKSDAEDAREHGHATIRAHCGVMVPVPVDGGRDLTEADFNPSAPTEEYEGPDGEFWVEMECVDCARVANQRKRERRRKLVSHWLTWAVKQHLEGHLTDDDIDILYDALDKIPERKQQNQ
ncbi:MAG: hypothetical protein CME34_18780 [Gordonia sp.]|uniref:hypothetical protein n=1 Tax=Gordonia sp. (in: high G+C Gram-positive bacteria) TaxID=84139 RepID=UPI000C590137|nr:hypothetical protein [Gordonia sp. (in: high G+C Gram-positive bacteria)]MAU83872.1 hypothetical protein [Gordonia sp. (in: high G+C Gram-positive bacteria)]